MIFPGNVMPNTIIEVADDILQIRLPLPFALRIVNCYLLRDASGWTIVDTGLNTPEGRAVWQDTFTRLGIVGGDLRRIILTHTHPDHFGMAGWLQDFARGEDRVAAVPVLLSEREVVQVRQVWQHPEGTPEPIGQFFGFCGVPADLIATVAADITKLRHLTRPHPPRFEILSPGTTIQIGKRAFEIIHTPGHSDGHLIFYDRHDHLLLCGDHVLRKITPNISWWPHSEPEPLGRYLRSLQALAALPVRLALPGHGPIFSDWQTRLSELAVHHANRLESMLAAADGAATAFTVAQKVFDFSVLTSHEIRFAVAETLAHLEYLVAQNQLRSEKNGVWQYRRW